ncbi:BMP family ABC transporter substrate-binding protein [Periweissella cryptocerci]|uniref:BMP family ABC transporter substrate-binding protein n=2 Tax=Periweissella cryptocerci TaxID=2506420 RepID=A0A4P6YXL0_9LACO|nr:BMP family ABC transporter substrate-binding protein [Periweissella cryptocerci]
MKYSLIGVGVAVVIALIGVNMHKPSKAAEGQSTAQSVAMVTNGGGVDDRSFNQSTWEGITRFGKANGLKKGMVNGKPGYDYFNSDDQSQFLANFLLAAKSNYKIVFGAGFQLADSIKQAAAQYPKTKFVIIDSVVKGKNIASVNFRSNEASYLAGVAAAKTTKTNTIGFVGGMHSELIDMFQAGYMAGAKSVNPKISIKIAYANTFTDASKGSAIAAAMTADHADVIYSAAGQVGSGVAAELRSQNQKVPAADKKYFIGVDIDQHADGDYTDSKGVKSNFTLTSVLTQVGNAANTIATAANDGYFPAGKDTILGLKENGVDIVKTELSPAIVKATDKAKAEIIAGKITVSATLK